MSLEIENRFKNFKSGPVTDRLKHYIIESAPENLFHIDLYRLADEWDVDRVDMLDLFLRGTAFGIFEMKWEYHCPQCGGVARESLKLSESSRDDYCPVCELDFHNTLDDNIEVFFSISEALKPVPDSIKKIYLEKVMHDVTSSGVFEWRKSTTINGIDCTNNTTFLEVFGTDTLPKDQSLEIKHAVILFTDIKGSTLMYEQLGDSRAFKIVRDHFVILFNEIIKFNGVPVKTMGDAVMGVFTNVSDALSAAIESQISFKLLNREREPGEHIELKIGIHTGPVLLVTLNSRLDYFGSTVNTASKIQSIAQPHEVLFSEEVYRDSSASSAIKGYTNKIFRVKHTLSGIKESINIYKVII